MIIYHYDAFSNQPEKGNPAGVVLEAEMLSEAEMQEIATEVGFNETSFICPSEKADIQMRYFTPGHEMNLCGHGTVASLVALHQRRGQKNIRSVETKAGIIDVKVKELDSREIRIAMKQLPARFVPFNGEAGELASVLGIDESEIEMRWPIVYGNTGIWTLLVPVMRLETFGKMRSANRRFPEVLSQISRASIHPFCLETYNPEAEMHGRHFSSPYSGTIEDAVTGTASGVMGAYYLNYVSNQDAVSVVVEQGQEIDKDGRVIVNVTRSGDELEVEIEGEAVFVKEIELIDK